MFTIVSLPLDITWFSVYFYKMIIFWTCKTLYNKKAQKDTRIVALKMSQKIFDGKKNPSKLPLKTEWC